MSRIKLHLLREKSHVHLNPFRMKASAILLFVILLITSCHDDPITDCDRIISTVKEEAKRHHTVNIFRDSSLIVNNAAFVIEGGFITTNNYSYNLCMIKMVSRESGYFAIYF